MSGTSAEELRTALGRRLAAVGGVLHSQDLLASDTSELDLEDRFVLVCDTVHAAARPDLVWLLMIALAGSYPDERSTRIAVSRRRSWTAEYWRNWLLNAPLALTAGPQALHSDIEIVSGTTLVDVDACARFNRHTGIQRVVRETVPLWNRDHELLLVGWTGDDNSLRRLNAVEEGRVLRWPRTGSPPPEQSDRARSASTILVPIDCAILIPEIPNRSQSEHLSALAVFSSNTVGVIGYDAIPAIAPEFQPMPGSDGFAHYLRIIRHADVVAGISATAAAEFASFVEAARIQQRLRVRIVECALPWESPPHSEHARPRSARPPLVLVVGSHEPRKNHLRILQAAERNWASGLRFELRMVGGAGWDTEVEDAVERLAANGRTVKVSRTTTDQQLAAAYRDAAFTIFPSLYEGYGLPVAESLAAGTPVITSEYGAPAEIGDGGGVVRINPRRVDEIENAMRSMLTDTAFADRLRAEASAFQPRNWEDYASELWVALTETALA